MLLEARFRSPDFETTALKHSELMAFSQKQLPPSSSSKNLRLEVSAYGTFDENVFLVVDHKLKLTDLVTVRWQNAEYERRMRN